MGFEAGKPTNVRAPKKRITRRKPSSGGGFVATPDQQDRSRAAAQAQTSPAGDRAGSTGIARANRFQQTPAGRQGNREAYKAAPLATRQAETRRIARKRTGLSPAEREAQRVHAERAAADERIVRETGINPRVVFNDTASVRPTNRMPRPRSAIAAELFISHHPELTEEGRKTIREHPEYVESAQAFKAGGESPIAALGHEVKGELEGKGVLAKGLEKLGGLVEHRVEHHGLPPIPGITGADSLPGMSKVRKATAGHSKFAAKQGAADVLSAKELGRAAQDLVNAPAQALPSLYVPAAGAVEALQGHPERLKDFLHNIDKTDPIYNTVAAGVDALGGKSAEAKARVKAAWNAAVQHPGFTALEVAGAKGALGRGAGRAMRSGALGEGAKAAASTAREPLRLPGTNIEEARSYSPDVITKAGRVLTERNRRGRAERALVEARRVEHENPQRAAELRAEAERLHPTHVRESDIQRRVDEHLAAEETVRRHHRATALSETDAIVKPVRGAGPLVSLIAQGIVHADPADVRTYMHELEGEMPHLSNAGKAANKRLRADLEKALAHVANGKVDLSKVEDTARAYRAQQAGREVKLAQAEMLPADQAAKAAVIPYAVRRMGAKHVASHWIDTEGKRVSEAEVRRVRAHEPATAAALYEHVPEHLADAHGEPLTLEAIRSHMEAHGEPVPSYLSQAPNARGARNYFRSAARPPSIGGERRTGEATRGGTFDAHPDTLRENAARQQGLIDAFDGFTNFLHEFGYRGRDGRLRTVHTVREGERAIRDAMYDEHGDPIPGAIKWRLVRANPFGGRAEQFSKMLEGNAEDAHVASHEINHAVEAALDGAGAGEGPYVLVPDVAASRLQQHVRMLNPDNAGRVAQKVNTVFRRTVLGTSLPWIVGNVVEGTGRAALARAGVRSYLTGKRVLSRAQEIDKDRGERLAARTVGGGHFGSVKGQEIHFNADALDPGKVKTVAQAATAFFKAPGPKQAAALWHGWTHVVFDMVNSAAESRIQTAMLGKAVRDSGLMDGELRKLSERAIDQAARGALDVNTAAELGRAVDRMYGKYGKWSPSERKAIALYTPFVAWTLNAAYFVVRTLPRDHPVATLVIAATTRATDEWRKEHGLDEFVKGAVPDWLQGSIPLPGGAHLRVARYTPLGAWGDPVGTATSAVLPQLSGVLAAGRGETWDGKKLSDTSPAGKTKAAATSFLESTIPAFALTERIAQKGPKAAIVDSTLGKVPPSRKKVTRARTSSSPGFASGGNSGAGFVDSGGSGAGFVGQ